MDELFREQSRVLVVAPHPDDEVLGVGGTLLRRKKEGAKIAWVIVTNISEEFGWDKFSVEKRIIDIERVVEFFKFDEVFTLNYQATRLDTVPMRDLVESISSIIKRFSPSEVFVPHYSDVHTDHRIVHDAVIACTKWFRYPFVRRVLAYETLSETDFCLSKESYFRPNVFVNIESFIDDKVKAMEIYTTEIGVFPFPRSRESIIALSSIRGVASGYKAAEAFELLRERI